MSAGCIDDAPLPERPADPAKNPNAILRGPGCGTALPTEHAAKASAASNGYVQFHVMQTGATLAGTDATKAVERTFWVRVPADYDPSRAYRVVYLALSCGNHRLVPANLNTYPLFDESRGGTEQAIYVALDLPSNMPFMDCNDVSAGASSQEWELFPLIQDFLNARYCVDNNRIFVVGWDYGAYLAGMWGCYFGAPPDEARPFGKYRIRGQMTVSDGNPVELPPCAGPVAAISINDRHNVSSAGAQRAVDRVLKANGCEGAAISPWPPMPDVCVQHDGCPPSHPVVTCTTAGFGNSQQPERAIPAFARFVQLMDPAP